MKIAIDISPIVYETGVSTYTRNLVENLIKIDTENEYLLFGGSLRRIDYLKDFISDLSTKIKNPFVSKIFPLPPKAADFLWNKSRIANIEIILGKIDVLHSSDWTQPPTRAFSVTTIHDLIPITDPKLSHPKIIKVHKRRIELVKNYADKIIVPSEATKEDAVKIGVKRDRMVVIPEAPDPMYSRSDKRDIDFLKKHYRIGTDYLLAVGVSPRKNLNRIIEAYDRINMVNNLKLVVVGEVKARVKMSRGVVFLGHVPNSDLPILYSGASALVYASLVEGFGLPILEAFSCGTPVITSKVGSMKEVAGNAAELVDPYNIESIKSGMEKVLKNRQRYIKNGTKRAKEFSWKKVAQDTIKVYKDAKD